MHIKELYNSKDMRTLSHFFGKLKKDENYIIEYTSEELKEMFLVFPQIKVGRRFIFIRPENYYNLSEKIYDNNTVKALISRHTIVSMINKIILLYINHQINGLRRSNEQYIQYLLELISKQIKTYVFFVPIEGIEIDDDFRLLYYDKFSFCSFTKEMHSCIRQFCYSKKSESDYLEDIIGAPVAVIKKHGDRDAAYEQSLSTTKKFIAAITLFYSAYRYFTYKELAIKLRSEGYSKGANIFYLSNKGGQGVFPFRTLKGKKIPLKNNARLSIENEEVFKRLFYIIFHENNTDSELKVLNALQWFGEAQSETDEASSLVKFITSIESISSNKREKIGERLSAEIDTLIRYGNYRPDDLPDDFKSTIKSLYRLRGKVVHEGVRNGIKQSDLKLAAYAATWSILNLAGISQKYPDPNDIYKKCCEIYAQQSS